MNSIVIYSSKYGATKQYAEWIGKALQISVFNAEETDSHEIIRADILFIGTSVYIGRLRIKKWLKKNAVVLKNKKIILFMVCGTPVEEKDKWTPYIRQSVPDVLREQCSVHVLPGRMWFAKASFWDRLLLRFNASTTSDRQIKDMMLKGYDKVERKNILPVLQEYNRLASPQPTTKDIHQ